MDTLRSATCTDAHARFLQKSRPHHHCRSPACIPIVCKTVRLLTWGDAQARATAASTAATLPATLLLRDDLSGSGDARAGR